MQHNEINLVKDIPIYLKNLNKEQLEAATHVSGPILVLAGAGTGKTKVLTSRIANLILAQNAYPNQVLAVTFTNKAANEMRQRVNQYVDAQGLWLGTFHSIAVRILKKHSNIFNLSENFIIIGADDQLRLIKKILKEENIDDKKYNSKLILNIIQRWKDSALKYESIQQANLISPAHHIAKNIYKIYQQKLHNSDAVDFGDLLLLVIELLNNNPDLLEFYQNKFKFILVDEYQDTNVAQYLWLRLLAAKHHNICCVGDEDQSIYGWRGAEIGNILKFEKDFPEAKIIKLEQNYRSTNNILFSASKLISHNRDRLGKNLWSNDSDGEKIKIINCWNEKEESEYIAKSIKQFISSNDQVAILVRASFQTRSLEECFINHKIPYSIIGGLEFYQRLEIKDIIAYIRIILNSSDSLALERIINVPKRGIGPATITDISNYALANNLSILSAIVAMLDENYFKPKVKNTLANLIDNLAKWKSYFINESAASALSKVMEESGYLAMWNNDKSMEASAKIENIRELIQTLNDYKDIYEFLEHVSLISERDSKKETNIFIMTIHAAKGLEFDCVFLPGWEETIFPHQRALNESDTNSIEEERRLAYVAMTRAKKSLSITKTTCRNIFGQWQTSIPSRFINELPQDKILILESANHNNNDYNFKRQSSVTYNFAEQSDSQFKIGSRVKHKKFGEGYILKISNDQIEVSFDNFGIKKILSDYISSI